MLHVHDSRLHMRELDRADLLGEAAQVRLAAQANSEEPVRSRPAAWRARFTGATQALIRRVFLPFASADRPAVRPTSFR